MTWAKLVINKLTLIHLARLRRWQSLDAGQIQHLQLRKLKRLLHQADAISFYRKRFRDHGFDPRSVSSLKDLERLPLLTKNEYRQFSEEHLAANQERYRDVYRDGTSGSTGMPLRIVRTWGERAFLNAKWMNALYANGYSWRDQTFSLPSPHRLQKDTWLQALGMFRRSCVPYTAPVEEMVQGYLKCRPDVLYANKSQLMMMAEYIRNNNIPIKQPRFCVNSAETLDLNSRKLISDVFGTRFVDSYGMVELGTVAWQKLGEDFLRFSHATDILELVDCPSQNSNVGSCVITSLHVRSFPLIRYHVGDWLETEVLNGERVIRKIRGRQDDWVVLRSGHRIPFHAFYEVMERRGEVHQFRVVQEEYARIKLELVGRKDVDREHIEAILRHDLRAEIPGGDDMVYEFEWKDCIASDPNGKLRMLISKVKQG